MSNPSPTPVSGSDELEKGVSDRLDIGGLREEANPTPVSDRLDIGGSDEADKGLQEELKGLQRQVASLQSQLAEYVQYTIPDVEVNKDESALEKVKKVRMLVEDLSCYIAHIRVAKLMANLLYDDKIFSKPSPRRNEKGICVIVVDHLIRKLWVSKKDLAESLKIKEKLMSEILGFLKENHFVKCFPEEAKEQNKGKNKRKRDENIYYSLEYEKIPKVALYLSLKIQQKFNKEKLLETYFYLCEQCNKHYSSLDSLSLIGSGKDGFFCEVCGRELLNLAKRFENIANDRLQRMKDNFAPIQMLIDKIETLPLPNFAKEPIWKNDSPEFREIEDSDLNWGQEESEAVSDDPTGD